LCIIRTAYPWSSADSMKIIEWKYPVTSNQRLRYKIYKDLWEKNYYITSGEKFGGDFLVYPGIIFISFSLSLNYVISIYNC